ncbi:MAG TPA: hypothetical protein VFB38_24535 [Chthonomonadaceae bacterium]|nr:hypothetical protein [Chthonomonadaceae bacterium]
MAITVELTPELEEQLRDKATAKGLSVEGYFADTDRGSRAAQKYFAEEVLLVIAPNGVDVSPQQQAA